MFPMCSRTASFAILLAIAAHAQEVAAAQPWRFDLFCNARGHVAADPQNRRPSEAQRWNDQFHYVVDLRARRFCEPAVCVHLGIDRIVAANSREIVLFDLPIPTHRHNAIRVEVRNRDGYYSSRMVDTEGYARVESGTCRRARFSGFPARRGPAWPR